MDVFDLLDDLIDDYCACFVSIPGDAGGKAHPGCGRRPFAGPSLRSAR